MNLTVLHIRRASKKVDVLALRVSRERHPNCPHFPNTRLTHHGRAQINRCGWHPSGLRLDSSHRHFSETTWSYGVRPTICVQNRWPRTAESGTLVANAAANQLSFHIGYQSPSVRWLLNTTDDAEVGGMVHTHRPSGLAWTHRGSIARSAPYA